MLPLASSSDSAFGMDMIKRMLQTGHPTMLSWLSKLTSYTTYSQCVPEVKWILMLISQRVYIRWVQRAGEPSNGSKVNPRCILSCFIFVKIFFLYNLPFHPLLYFPFVYACWCTYCLCIQWIETSLINQGHRSFHIMGMLHVCLLIKNDEVVYAMVYGLPGVQ